MGVVYLHFSDIHFGQEKGGRLIIHRDVRERVIDDVQRMVTDVLGRKVDGIIVTGDIAYSGLKEEYAEAGKWLDRVAGAADCPITDVQVVPGNHDIDRREILKAAELMLSAVAEKGEDVLDSFMEAEGDREVFYARFRDYREFAGAYDCPLDREGGAAGDKVVELSPGRYIRVVGLNSALCCAKSDSMGKLLLGARQRVLPRTAGVELVVLCHHPLHWLRDSDEARRYVRSRARVFISGHEHSPKIDLDHVRSGCDLLMLASGATVPPLADAEFTYTYNVLEFHWDEQQDALKVVVHPRVWSPSKTAFEANSAQFEHEKLEYTLGCPNFRDAGKVAGLPKTGCTESSTKLSSNVTAGQAADMQTIANTAKDVSPMEPSFPTLLLRFFRDLTAAQRLGVLLKFGVLPADWRGSLTHSMERHALESLRETGKLDEVFAEINRMTGSKPGETH